MTSLADIKRKVLELTGYTDDIEEGLDQWEQEQIAFGQLHDEIQALAAYIVLLRRALDQGLSLVRSLQKDGGLFVNPVTHKAAERFMEIHKTVNEFMLHIDDLKKG